MTFINGCKYNIHPVVDQHVNGFAQQRNIVDESEIRSMKVTITNAVNGILQCAKLAVDKGDKTPTADFPQCMILTKYNQVVATIVENLWGFSVAPIGNGSFGGMLDGPALMVFACFNISWKNSNDRTYPKPKFVPFKSSPSSDFSQFQCYREKGDFTDVHLICGDKTYPAHRLVLATRSDFFRASLMIGMKECVLKTFPIDVIGMGSDQAHFEEFLDFIYTDKIDLKGRSVDDIDKLLTFARAYFVKGLITACTYEIAQQFNDENL
ncbi:MAG TPA: BTB/POZ domain-containing protein, partial [Rhabdochlamydiaceae bacterium]